MKIIQNHFWAPAHNYIQHSRNDLLKLVRMIKKKNLFHISDLIYCHDCMDRIEDIEFHSGCNLCTRNWHLRCIPSSPDDIYHPFHADHPLKLLIDGPPENSKGKCDACQEELKSYFYHCSICDFSMHVRCCDNHTPPIVETSKCHKHTLTCMVRYDTFTCNACGTHGERCPYVCAPCGVMFHQECIDLPHVININRHDHRVSHTYSLGFGNRKCMICHQKVDWRYGAYSCSTCPDDYVVHSKCATRDDVWDGKELEGVPEEIFDVSSFQVIEEEISIKHFSHEHILYKTEDEDHIPDGSMCCEACVHPIFSETHYKCLECDFIIHETCAKLPRRKRHWLSTTPFSLNASNDDTTESLFRCGACETASSGFRYETDKGVSIDMRCASVISSCDSKCHPHTLFLTTLDKGFCGGCKLTKKHVLRCTESECGFSLCLACATLPGKIKRKGDEHFLFLCHGEDKASGEYWCEVCETTLDPHKEWFYACNVSGVTFHIKCVVGEFPNAKPGFTDHYECVLGEDISNMCFKNYRKSKGEEEENEVKIQLVPNDSITRPKCGPCGSRCVRPLILKLVMWDTYECYCCDVECSRHILKNLTDKYEDQKGIEEMYGETSQPSDPFFLALKYLKRIGSFNQS